MKDRIQYGYDRAGNRTWRENLVAPENQDQHYLYDPLYQVTAAARGNLNLNQTAIGGIPAQRQTFDYDPTGNWDRYTTAEEGVQVLNQTRIHNQANQIVQIDGSNTGLLYDRAGNATQMPPDASGDWSEHYKLTWDAWNRLVKVENQEEEEMASYAYDGRMRRTTKTVDEEVTHAYYNEKWKAVEERVDDSEDPHLQYLWGARPNHRDELVRRDRDADDSGSLEEKLYCLMDYFDPTSVIDEAGNVEERYQFSAFGLRQVSNAEWSPASASEYDFEFSFHGQLLDMETSYYNYGFRYYSPQIGRWANRDPLEEQAGQSNLFLFAHNSPISTLDLLGLASVQFANPVLTGGTGGLKNKLPGFGIIAWTITANVAPSDFVGGLLQIVEFDYEYFVSIGGQCHETKEKEYKYDEIAIGGNLTDSHGWSPVTEFGPAKNVCYLTLKVTSTVGFLDGVYAPRGVNKDFEASELAGIQKRLSPLPVTQYTVEYEYLHSCAECAPCESRLPRQNPGGNEMWTERLSYPQFGHSWAFIYS